MKDRKSRWQVKLWGSRKTKKGCREYKAKQNYQITTNKKGKALWEMCKDWAPSDKRNKSK